MRKKTFELDYAIGEIEKVMDDGNLEVELLYDGAGYTERVWLPQEVFYLDTPHETQTFIEGMIFLLEIVLIGNAQYSYARIIEREEDGGDFMDVRREIAESRLSPP